jgi:hypothetical protein
MCGVLNIEVLYGITSIVYGRDGLVAGKRLGVHTSVNLSMTDEGNEEINRISSTMQDTSSVSATLSREIQPQTIRKYLNDKDKDKIPIALLLTSVRVENKLHRMLERDINETETTLGNYINYAKQDGIVNQHLVDEEDGTLWDLNTHRTNLVHDDGYWESTYSNPEIREKVVDTVEETLKFLDE